MNSRTVGVALVVFALAVVSSYAQMSPGPLSQAHQGLDTPLQCAACHVVGAGSAQFKCLDCHEEIRRRLSEKRGYHARIVKGTGMQAAVDCARCHAEHNGRQHQLVRWRTPRNSFDHRQAGWALEGKHKTLTCEKCHTVSKMTPEHVDSMKPPGPGKSYLTSGKSYLGLSPLCSSCHTDQHRGDLGQDCTRCHNHVDWKDLRGFSHDKSSYPLRDLHQKVACAQCHKRFPATTGRVQYKNFVIFESCKACHKDPHGGSFSGDCQKCHSTAGWKPARVAESGFDHSRTKFPLKGKHRAVDCKKCHRTENFGAPLPYKLCLDCHKDSHQGQFVAREGGECAPCHNESGWKPASFTVKDHASTRYPLLGLHAKVACAECHVGMGAKANYHPDATSCNSCHKDRHQGQFAAAPHLNRCERCHTVSGWKPARFTPVEHAKSRMALTGAHAAVACTDCHKRAATTEETKFRFASVRCLECHENPHGPAGATKAECESCHTTRNWKETGPFDHGSTGYPLSGKHRTAPCTGCHKPEIPGGKRLISFRGTTRQCGSCHADVHDGQFQTATESKPDCGRCHTSTNWQPTGFDHQKHSTFSLKGAHDRVPCRMCHANRRLAGSRQVVIYRGTPRECEECHR